LQCSSYDPDCIICTPGAPCSTNTQCGREGICVNKRCNCLVSAQ
jgi:hypothetical protein